MYTLHKALIHNKLKMVLLNWLAMPKSLGSYRGSTFLQIIALVTKADTLSIVVQIRKGESGVSSTQ